MLLGCFLGGTGEGREAYDQFHGTCILCKGKLEDLVSLIYELKGQCYSSMDSQGYDGNAL